MEAIDWASTQLSSSAVDLIRKSFERDLRNALAVLVPIIVERAREIVPCQEFPGLCPRKCENCDGDPRYPDAAAIIASLDQEDA